MPDSHEITSDNENEFVIFLIGMQEYCIDIMSLKEIRGWTSTTALPDAPPFVRGVINLRGAVVPIMDLAERLGLARTEQKDRSVIMITSIGSQTVGLLADAVIDILAINPDTIQTPPQLSSHETASFINGLVALEGRMISVINLNAVLMQETQEVAA